MAAALFSDRLDVKLITTVAGNVSVDKVTANALKLLTFGVKDSRRKGAAKPLIDEFVDASHVHGKSGLAGFDFPEIDSSLLVKEHAVNKMRDVIMAEEKITLVAIGPLTNVALLFAMYPEVKKRISRIVMMGGSLARGNKGVMSEFNFATDPHAAKMVFASKLPLSWQVWTSGVRRRFRVRILKNWQLRVKPERCCAPCLKIPQRQFCRRIAHVRLVCNRLPLQPDLFETADVFADIELSGTLTAGCSVVDLDKLLKRKPNATVLTSADTKRFRTWFVKSLSKCI